jgi:hypothetical protein
MTAALPLLLAHLTAAIIGTGIDARQGVFIQEFHQGERVKYLLANTGEKPAKVSVVKFDSTWRIGQPIGKVLAGPWEIPAKGSLEVDVSDLASDDLLRFFNADGSPLGVLHAPRKPAAAVGLKARTAAGGLNGMGNYVDGLTVALPANAVARGQKVTARLVFQKNVRGTLKFTPLAAPNPAVGPQLHPASVTCGTLTVRQEGENWIIDFNKPDKVVDEHIIELNFQVPADHPEPLFVWSGWLANSMGGGVTIARGMEVKK